MLAYDELFSQIESLVSSAKELFSSYDDLKTFHEAAEWDSDATSLLELYKDITKELAT